jgi:hypothetical protein
MRNERNLTKEKRKRFNDSKNKVILGKDFS